MKTKHGGARPGAGRKKLTKVMLRARTERATALAIRMHAKAHRKTLGQVVDLLYRRNAARPEKSVL